jgi:hypothetical protein
MSYVPTQLQRASTTTITQPAKITEIQLRTTTYTVSKTIVAPTVTVVRAATVTSVRTATVTRQVVGAAGVGKTVTRVVTRTVSGCVFW